MQNENTMKKLYYGIKLNPVIFQHIAESEVKDICRLLFLNVDFPIDKTKQILNRIETDKTFDVLRIKQLLQQQLDERLDFLKSTATTITLIPKIEEWSTVFEMPNHAELNELIEFYGIEDDEVLKISRMSLMNKIHSPADLKAMLDEYVIGQEEAKKSISFAFYLHLLRIHELTPSIYKITRASRLNDSVELPKPTMMLIGPTGSGKTFILTQLCSKFGIPFVRIDCASLVASGYVGNNLNDSLFQLLRSTDYNIEKASTAVIYFDEFDKISESQIGRSGSVGGIELQQEFLSVIENKELFIKPPRDSREEKAQLLPSKNLMFVFSGSFAGMEKSINKRLNLKDVIVEKVGFKRTNHASDDKLSLAEPLLVANHQDLIDFGIIPELVGRVNFIVPLHKLTKSDIISIIKESKLSPLKPYQNFFYIHYDELIIEEEVYELMAEEILKKGTGARAILSVLQALLKDYLYDSPDNEFTKYTVTAEYFNKIFPNKQLS
jgi:ATP-dependent Clp protease ATP-binding subunit ClpX